MDNFSTSTISSSVSCLDSEGNFIIVGLGHRQKRIESEKMSRGERERRIVNDETNVDKLEMLDSKSRK